MYASLCFSLTNDCGHTGERGVSTMHDVVVHASHNALGQVVGAKLDLRAASLQRVAPLPNVRHRRRVRGNLAYAI